MRRRRGENIVTTVLWDMGLPQGRADRTTSQVASVALFGMRMVAMARGRDEHEVLLSAAFSGWRRSAVRRQGDAPRDDRRPPPGRAELLALSLPSFVFSGYELARKTYLPCCWLRGGLGMAQRPDPDHRRAGAFWSRFSSA
jgi:hypothetical protein